ncbi:dolichyl-phosphate-mannose--protein mannosyltransferase [Mobiluncus curtisii]|uniref:Polyprenol-phosphate-mannose--protein mannosyltransferase n=1 Tax=Mobiluncus curtisii TaxID=2051 RepID=A0A7Y0YBW3_9ACTO|nr:phospholipid carrier-dependent glycosyltransferase [Mobiluncus curtisii]MCU9986723.1 phospholipid carrier-dependent glycosyltransferase [Mobiluncus curtisii]MCU9999624.1 phospholipid carrier-dependent glycosyltransferase [Mobiluncus curtisii]NMW49397.1 phospholipid carrier-dependent glycosyltransferase [Mobiluncus curtisii]NMW86457.1 phospholipid carrier-dependent glycosyltransferase [Mobiluncus curtisii]NMX13808.1 phospholipid carrier-dependent glycosyltransferase [Mobiluncus curtisii]
MGNAFQTRPERGDREYLWGWLGPLVVSILVFLTRVVRLDAIKTLVFDETYYVKDAYGLIKRGYEVQWPKDYDSTFLTGSFKTPLEGAFVVHPTVGKWLIGLGIKLFGNQPFGWRIAVCIAGAVAVYLVGRIVWELFGNARMATLASVLMGLDGVQIALSRTAILDIILEMFILLGVLCVVRDQLSYRPRLIAALASVDATRRTEQLRQRFRRAQNATAANSRGSSRPSTGSGSTSVFSNFSLAWGPSCWWRPWLFAAGIAFGLAMSVKWSGLYVLAVFGIFVFLRELSARWSTEPRWIGSSVLTGGIPAFVNLVPIAFLTYVASWIGWFTHSQAWGHTNRGLVADWLDYHRQIFVFHTNLDATHPYMANPWGWLLQLRPTSFYYQEVPGDCGSSRCIAAVNSLGNPILWWVGFVAFFLIIIAAFGFLDWRAGLIFTGYMATWLPWLVYSNRTIFTFYTVVISPFMIMAVIYLLGLLMGAWRITKDKNWTGRYNLVPALSQVSRGEFITALMILVFIFSAAVFFFPIWTGMPMPEDHYGWRMWLNNPNTKWAYWI